MRFVEEDDENLEDEGDLEELFPENQVQFQLQPGKTKLYFIFAGKNFVYSFIYKCDLYLSGIKNFIFFDR